MELGVSGGLVSAHTDFAVLLFFIFTFLIVVSSILMTF